MQGLKCIIVQEAYDSREVGQPEIIEKARPARPWEPRWCRSPWALSSSMSPSPLLEDTDFFNASPYSPSASPASKHWAMRLPFSAAPSLAGSRHGCV